MTQFAKITKWDDAQTLELYRRVTEENVHKAAVWFSGQLKKCFDAARKQTNVRHLRQKGYTTQSGRKMKAKYHSSSVPGSVPAVDTGTLRASIAYNIYKSGPLGITADVGSDLNIVRRRVKAGTNVDYGYFLEVGTRKMAARPWITPTWNAKRMKVLDILTTGKVPDKGQ